MFKQYPHCQTRECEFMSQKGIPETSDFVSISARIPQTPHYTLLFRFKGFTDEFVWDHWFSLSIST